MNSSSGRTGRPADAQRVSIATVLFLAQISPAIMRRRRLAIIPAMG
jgi:hypothetical protein